MIVKLVGNPTTKETNAAMAADTTVWADVVRHGDEEMLKDGFKQAIAAVAILQHEVVRLTKEIRPENVSPHVEG